MDFIENLFARNAEYSRTKFNPELKMMPTQRTLILGCVDPRVDPMDILQLNAAETAIMRNVGGRVTPDIHDTLDVLVTVSKAGGKPMGEGWNLVLLQHTDCGIKGCMRHAPQKLAKFMGVASEADLEPLEIMDPYKAIKVDIAALKANPNLPAEMRVTGIVYDTATGKIEMVAEPSFLGTKV